MGRGTRQVSLKAPLEAAAVMAMCHLQVGQLHREHWQVQLHKQQLQVRPPVLRSRIRSMTIRQAASWKTACQTTVRSCAERSQRMSRWVKAGPLCGKGWDPTCRQLSPASGTKL